MSCPNCISGSLSEGKYLCTTEDYRVVDNNDNLIWVVQTHEILSNDEEINSYQDVRYCACQYWET